MDNFANASFAPALIAVMQDALDRFHETGLAEISIHGTGIMLVDSSFEKR
jgi:hypothetical protein